MAGGSGLRKVAWVAWEDVCKGVIYGGMGLGFLEWKNKAMLLKWFWRSGREGGGLWKKMMCAKYGLEEKMTFPLLDEIRPSMGSCVSVDLGFDA